MAAANDTKAVRLLTPYFGWLAAQERRLLIGPERSGGADAAKPGAESGRPADRLNRHIPFACNESKGVMIEVSPLGSNAGARRVQPLPLLPHRACGASVGRNGWNTPLLDLACVQQMMFGLTN